ncbi:MAG: TonB-dependent receptor [Flavobacteriales bacterium]|nr:TonB-dependent receptor [Flavobacteriales bacterium]
MTLYGQAQTRSVYRIVDSRSGEGLPFTEVILRSPDGKVFHSLADDQGKARIEVPEGSYQVKLFCVGYRNQEFRADLPVQTEQVIGMVAEDALLRDVVVTSQYSGRSARSAVEKIEVIDTRMLESRSIFNLREAVLHRMNVQVRQDNSTGSAMSLMGISGQNVKIMIDGVPVIGRLDGNIDLSQINLNDVERIEVIEGPVSTNYGTNALAGVINIITKKGRERGLSGQAEAYYESAGYYNASFNTAHSFGKTGFRLSAGRNFFAGWSPEESGRWQLWKPKEQYWGRVVLSRQIGGFEVFLRSEYFNEFLLNRGRPLTPYFESAFDEHFRTERLDQQLQFRKSVAKGREIDGFVAYNYYKRRRNSFFRDLVQLEEDRLETDGSNDTTRFDAFRSRSTYSFSSPGSRLNYQLGYDAVHDIGSGLRIEGGSRTMTDLAIFGSAEYRLSSRLMLKPGLRLSWNSAYQAPVIPMLSARYGRGNYVYRASWSRGFRAPDLKELYIFFVDVNHNVQGNPDLKAESSDNFNFSISGTRQMKKGFLKPSLSTFYNQISNKINLANIRSDLYTYVNIDEFRSAGGRLNMEWLNERTRLNGGIGITAVNNGLNVNGGRYYQYLEGNAAASRTIGNTWITLSAKYNGKQQIYVIDAENQEVTQRETRAYTLMDLQVSREFLSKRLQCSGGIKNVMNVGNIESITAVGGAHGSESVAVPIGTGRSYFVRISYRFQKLKPDA